MRRFLLQLTLAVAVAVPGGVSRAQGGPAPFDRWFTEGTMRVDYFHTGGQGAEIVALDRVVDDGPWPGSRTSLLDASGLGHYAFQVEDAATRTPLYSRGFSSVFAEWVTTAEVRATHRTFHESLRFPWPKVPVRVVLRRREPGGALRDVWSTRIDPAASSVTRARLTALPPVWPLVEQGPPADKVDLLLVPAGYTAAELPKFHADAARLVDAMFAVEPYRSRRGDFNLRGLDLPAALSGVSQPARGVFRRDALSVEYSIFGTERYMLATDNRALRDAASAAPYDVVEVLVNATAYGGGGIFGAHATVAVDHVAANYVFIHEFAHHFAGLGDEYYGSAVAYETGKPQRAEPWEPNVTALRNPATLKWRDLVAPGTPVPTPWDRTGYDALVKANEQRVTSMRKAGASAQDLDAEGARHQASLQRFLAGLPYAGAVGAFEGASYEARGLYRPSLNCIMFTRDDAAFCRVCQRAIGRAIDAHTGH
ncbi:MAG: M64 family metallopeptidase [Vicinamibacterales bacterium]|nr:M64 family metallopeptidase [Vicinamibacterales bacterium]